MSLKEQVLGFLIQYGFRIVGGLAILTVGFFLSRFVARLAKTSLRRFKLEPPVENLLVRVARILVIALAGVVAVGQMGVNIGPLVAGIGVVGVGIGLATQGVLANVVAGLTIIFTKPFRVGEYVEIVSVDGVVCDIGLFATKLRHFDQSIVTVPNRKIVGEIMHNYGAIRQLNLSVGVAYDSRLDLVNRVVAEILATHPLVLKDPAPAFGISELDDSSINLSIAPWVKVSDFPVAPSQLYRAILDRFEKERIVMPFPQQEIRLLRNHAAITMRRSTAAIAETGL